MSDSTLAFVVQSARRSVDLGKRLLVGIEADRFARLPVVGGKVVQTNHPAFIYGHLSLYPAKIAAICGLADVPAAPLGFEECFKRESVCHDDVAGTIYPPMERITEAFFRGYDWVLTELSRMDGAVLERPNPDPRLAATFPTVGFATVFLACNHVATHMGQVSGWRRCMGLPPA